MYTCIYTYIYIHMYIYISVYVCTCDVGTGYCGVLYTNPPKGLQLLTLHVLNECIHLHVYNYVFKYTYVHAHTYLFIKPTCEYICVYICM